MKVEVRARDMNIQRQQRSIGELHDEIRDLKQLETELKQLLQKKMALEEQNQDMKGKLFDKFIDNQKTEITDKEKEIESRGMLAKLQSLQEKVDELEKQKAERAQLHAKELSELRSTANTSNVKVEEIVKERDDWVEKCTLLEKQLIQADVEASNLKHNKGTEV